MKIAIISDIHDNLANLEIFFKLIEDEKIEKIICCGDVSNIESIEKISSSFPGEIFLVFGNAEVYNEKELSQFSNINYLGRFSIQKIDSLNIGICHEPGFMRDLFTENKDLDFIFYGHTHKPWISMKNKATLINPGTLGGVFQKPSFAIFDTQTKKAKLKILHQ